jgi:hypothetical protein
MAHKKAGGSHPATVATQPVGVLALSVLAGKPVTFWLQISSSASAAPSIIQGNNVGMGKDHTMFALVGWGRFSVSRNGRGWP